MKLTIAKLILLIATKEGFWVPGTIPSKLHNPCALVYIGQPEATKGPRGFAKFERDEDGFKRCRIDLEHKLKHGHDLSLAWDYLKDGTI